MQSETKNLAGQTALRELTEQDEESLAALRQQNPARYRMLHEAALAYLNGQLAAGNEDMEPQWTAVFDRLAYLYVADDSLALIQLITQTIQLTLQTKAAQHNRQFFQGMAFVKQDLYADALLTFDVLLREESLSLALQARTLNARAVICRYNGRLEEAIAGYQASLTLWQQLNDHHYQGIVNLNLGIIAYGLRDYSTAENHFREAIVFFEATGSQSWLVAVQNELGLVERDLGNWEEAIICFKQVIVERSQDEAEEDVGMGYANIGEVLLFKGDLSEAKSALQQSLSLILSRAYRADPFLYLGLAHQAEGGFSQAESNYREALSLAQAADRQEFLPHIYYYLGDVMRRQGNDEAALKYWKQATHIIEESHTPMRDESLKISLLGRWQQVYEALILHCAALGRVEEAFMWAERARARAFAEGLEEDGLRPSSNTTISLPELQTTIPINSTLLCYFTTGVLEQDIPLLRAIPADNPLREHILTPAKTLRFEITPTSIQLRECPLDPNVFATSSPRGFNAQRFLKTAVLQRLHHDLLGTITASHLIIIPHGPLHRVPFTALLPQDKRPTLTFAPSATIYARQRERKVVRDTAISFLSVGYNGLENSRNLKYAENEAVTVAQIMGGQVWLKPTKAQLREQATACRYLHIACHGWFDEAAPLASYLELNADERLPAREVLESWNLQAELVTLSACETGISQILRGDEPMGLVRAFLYAGAKAVLVSQWPVDDLATFLLMTRFYEELQTTSDLSRALMNARNWLREIKSGEVKQFMQKCNLADLSNEDWPVVEKPFAPPQFWAGFVIVGI